MLQEKHKQMFAKVNKKDTSKIEFNYLNYYSDDVCIEANGAENLRFFYHTDHLGGTNFITEPGGLLYQRFEYTPFGEKWIEERFPMLYSYGDEETDEYSGEPSKWVDYTTWDYHYVNTPYRFTGQELDELTGLYYYGARYYDPQLSVFISRDPMEEKYPGISPYAYCANNPLRYIDPTGMTLEGSGTEGKTYLKNLIKNSFGDNSGFRVGRFSGKVKVNEKQYNKFIETASPEVKELAGRLHEVATNKKYHATVTIGTSANLSNSTFIGTEKVPPSEGYPPGTTRDLFDIRKSQVITTGAGHTGTHSYNGNLSYNIAVLINPNGVYAPSENASANIYATGVHEIFSHVYRDMKTGISTPQIGPNDEAVRIENMFRQLKGLPLRTGLTH